MCVCVCVIGEEPAIATNRRGQFMVPDNGIPCEGFNGTHTERERERERGRERGHGALTRDYS